MTEIIPFKSSTTGNKKSDEAGISDELMSMANRLEEIAPDSNMPQWISRLANEIRSAARSYRGK